MWRATYCDEAVAAYGCYSVSDEVCMHIYLF